MKKLPILLLSVLVTGLALLYAPDVKADGPNLIANPSVETAATTTTPQSWQTGGWGTNTSTYNYLNTGHTGTRSVNVQTTSYTDGDAKWYFAPATVTPNTTYTFSDWYQANVASRIVVQTTANDNSVSYSELTQAPATGTTWTQLTRSITTSATAKSVTVFHLLDKVGSLTIDDASLNAYTPPAPDPNGNLVLNASVEQAAAGGTTTPAEWTTNSWGTNTSTFSYLSTGHTGTHSVKTQVSGYSSGDAKWYFTPVTVTPNAYYAFSDWYQSTVATEVFAQFTKTDGTVSYVSLGAPAASSTWKQATYQVAIPANVNKLSVFHVIAKNGTLTLDDASVTLAAAPPTGSNPVPNPSLESAVGNLPAAWTSSKWGTNTANFQYMNEGHTGTHSAKVTVSNYTDGDAKWVFQPQPLEQGKQYRFTGWYKTNTQPRIVAMFNKADGTQSYFGMPQPLPAANASTTWQQYSDTFIVPSGAVSVSVFMFVNTNGWVQVDDFSIQPYSPTGFSRPLVSLTFDDGHEDNVQTVIPALGAKGFKSTQFFATQFIEGDQNAVNNVLAFKNAGHEIGSHTITHPFLTQVNNTQLVNELTHSQQYLQSITGAPIKNFASPYGDYNQNVLNKIMPLYRSHRTVDEGYNSKDNFSIYRIRVQNMQINTPLSQYQTWLDQAKATNTWLVLVYHRVVPTGMTDGEQFDTPQADFGQQMNALQASGLTVKTYDDALNELVPQL